jgi:hypothetical protein
MSDHELIWRRSTGAPPCGPDALLGWAQFDLSGDRFRRRYGADQICGIAAAAVSQAIDRRRDVTIVWGPSDPATTPVAELETAWRAVKPSVIICPEQPRRPDRWVVAGLGGTIESLPRPAIQNVLYESVEHQYPQWRPRGEKWNATALLVRHDLTALDLGLVEPYQLGPDDRIHLVSDDPQVRDAFRASDLTVPASMAALVRARLEAQARMGISPEDRAPIFSSEVETILMPVVMCMGEDDGPAKLMEIRGEMRQRYADMGETVLAYALRIYQHNAPGIDQLRAAAREAAAVPAA